MWWASSFSMDDVHIPSAVGTRVPNKINAESHIRIYVQSFQYNKPHTHTQSPMRRHRCRHKRFMAMTKRQHSWFCIDASAVHLNLTQNYVIWSVSRRSQWKTKKKKKWNRKNNRAECKSSAHSTCEMRCVGKKERKKQTKYTLSASVLRVCLGSMTRRWREFNSTMLIHHEFGLNIIWFITQFEFGRCVYHRFVSPPSV